MAGCRSRLRLPIAMARIVVRSRVVGDRRVVMRRDPGLRMTRRTNARIAGFALLFYIGIGVTELVLRSGGTSADGTAVRLARIGQQPSALVLPVSFSLIT